MASPARCGNPSSEEIQLGGLCRRDGRNLPTVYTPPSGQSRREGACGDSMNFLDQAVAEGHYAKKQILCKDRLISWSHRSRFELGLQLAREFSGKRILDYGCGDGTFLAMLMAQEAPPAGAVGCEINASLVEDCNRRLGD